MGLEKQPGRRIGWRMKPLCRASPAAALAGDWLHKTVSGVQRKVCCIGGLKRTIRQGSPSTGIRQWLQRETFGQNA